MIMIPVALGVALVAGYQAVHYPKQEAAFVAARSDVAAGNFLGYRTAVLTYLRDNPGATGTIADASLSAHWPAGYVRNTTQWPWTNVVSGGELYIYSTNATCGLSSCDALVDELFQKQQRTATVGVSENVGGVMRLKNPGIGVSSIVLPAAITAGRAVAIGK